MKKPISNQQGITIIEVMVALVLSSIALLGLAAGELKSLQYATNSFNYTVSLIQANNAIERTWTNLCGLQDGTIPYDAAYHQAVFTPQVATYQMTPTPGVGGAFTETLDIKVSWADARMADEYASVIHLNVKYPLIC